MHSPCLAPRQSTRSPVLFSSNDHFCTKTTPDRIISRGFVRMCFSIVILSLEVQRAQVVPANRNKTVRTQIWHKANQADATGPTNGLTGGASCSRSGNGHTGLTGGPDRSDRWTPSPSRIEESLQILSCRRTPCGARPPHPINIKGHDRLRGHHPIDHYFLQLLSLKP
jgi:hypothetical protein